MYSEQFIQAAEKACKELTDIERARILESIGERRPMPTEIADKLYDLMEEYGEDNNLPEDWWLVEGDTEEVYFVGTDND